MKFTFLIFVLSGGLLSCDPGNEVSSGENQQAPQVYGHEIQTKETTSSAADTVKPLLTARGSEPGWFAQFFSNRLRLLFDHGQDSLLIYSDFSEILKTENYKTVIPTQKYEVLVEIDQGSCTEEASGEKREKTISIKLNDKILKGCATSVIN